MKRRLICPLVLCLLCALVCGAAAEDAYTRLCSQHGLARDGVMAWLEIPGAAFTQPVMYNAEDDAYYAKHGADGAENAWGAVYIQTRYNAADGSDPVTILYGSSAAEGAPFRKLQETFSGSFDSCKTLYMHMPDGTRTYTVFAALPYTSIHILHYYDFRNARRYETFFDGVFSTRVLGMHLDEANRPEAGEDQVLILSTGLRGDSLQRYLVMAKLVSQ